MMRKAEFTFRDLTVRYLYDVPAQADAYLPMILYIPDSSLDHGYEKFISAEFQRNHPCSVIVPEVMDWVCPAVAQTIQRLIFDFRIKYKLDICRTYLVGAGYGAIGAWHLAGSYPRLFAAMVAIGGCADPYHIRNAKYMPIWAFDAAPNWSGIQSTHQEQKSWQNGSCNPPSLGTGCLNRTARR